jgi:ferredoxin
VYDLVDPGDEIISHEEKDDGTLVIETRHGKKQELNREEYLREACLECRFPKPENTDYDTGGDAREPGDGGYDKIKAFEEKSREERWEYFKEEMTKCIRCSACRQACPTCYCKECFAEQLDLNWIGMTTELTDSMLFQLVRIFHQAGRCVECDACYDACPMNIDLRTLTKKMVKDVEELFDYLPDFNTETVPPLSTFKEGDPEEFITDPEKKE